ncbi:MAG: AraC family transcriptional regulator [Lewinellaceae bacterium]|nr:AraC family transcriptional regulator [Phaeodactylibacter sp.]MCB9347947.1 AraC family transcriptional regulator [Lewinellaceae bacterium]
MALTIDNTLHVIIIFQGFLLAIFLFTHQRLRDRLLGGILILLAAQMLGLFLTNLQVGGSFFDNINCMYGFLYGVLFFFYTRSITRRDFALRPLDGLHLIPFGLSVVGIVAIGGAFCQPKVYFAYVLSISIYILFSFFEIRRYKRVVRNNYSRLEMLNLDWLQWAFLLFTFIILADFFSFAFFILGLPNEWQGSLVLVLILAFINTLYFKGLRQAEIFSGVSREDAALSTQLESNRQLDLSESEYKELINQLERHLRETEGYCDPNLTIGELADQLNVPKRRLSQLINAHYGQNFVDFINTYRIEKAKERFRNPRDEKETILEVMYEVGFNSKSSFNTVFKKKTGLTPSQYKDRD